MVDVIAPINIALLKYCNFLDCYTFHCIGGKSDYLNIEPVADSISLTLSSKQVTHIFHYYGFLQLHSRTKISLTNGVDHTFSLNGKWVIFEIYTHPLTGSNV